MEPRDDDQSAAARAPQRLHVTHLAVDRKAALLHVHRREPAVTRAAQQDAVAGIVAAEDGRHTVHVPRQEEIDAPIAVEVLRHGGVDGRELGLDGQRLERSEEHTSELQSPCNLVCRLLLEKKKILSVFYINLQSFVTILIRPLD